MNRRAIPLLAVLLLIAACTTSPSPTEPLAGSVQQPASRRTHSPTPKSTLLPPAWTATQTLVATNTRTVTPSPTSTLSPTAVITSTSPPTSVDLPIKISLSSTLIQLGDLPPGFEVMPYDKQDVKYLPLNDEGIEAMESVFYSNKQTKCSVLSATFVFANSASQWLFDQSIDDIEVIMQEQFDELGLYEMGVEVDIQVLSDFPAIGEKSVAIHLELGIGGIKTMTDISLFRIEGYGGVVMIVPSATDPDSVELKELAFLQYGRMVTILDGGS